MSCEWLCGGGGILQKNKTFAGNLAGGVTMLFCEDIPLRTVHVAVFIRIVKQSQLVFRFQYPAAGCIQRAHSYFSFFNGFHQCTDEAFTYHIHVHPCIKSECTDGLQVADTMLYHL